jgi:hypothetical protein
MLILAPNFFAEEKYSFEKTEELKSLIEWREYNSNTFQEAITNNKPTFLLLTAPVGVIGAKFMRVRTIYSNRLELKEIVFEGKFAKQSSK